MIQRQSLYYKTPSLSEHLLLQYPESRQRASENLGGDVLVCDNILAQLIYAPPRPTQDTGWSNSTALIGTKEGRIQFSQPSIRKILHLLVLLSWTLQCSLSVSAGYPQFVNMGHSQGYGGVKRRAGHLSNTSTGVHEESTSTFGDWAPNPVPTVGKPQTDPIPPQNCG